VEAKHVVCSFSALFLPVFGVFRYALDLRGELSAFDGQLLQQQMDFALACLRQLAAMYSNDGGGSSGSSGGSNGSNGGSSSGRVNVTALPPMLRPELTPAGAAAAAGGGSSSSSSDGGVGLLLVGHSMGGVIARAAAAAAWTDPLLGEDEGPRGGGSTGRS
jgi:hypothetical protein